jgi:hypothetical protein
LTVDVADVTWLSRALPELIELGPADAITAVGKAVKANASLAARAQLVDIIEIVLEERREDQNALVLAAMLLL